MWDSHLSVRPLPPLLLEQVLGHCAVLRSRLVACILRCKHVSVLIIEVYLFTGQALPPDNLAILQKVNELQAHTGLETIVMGDFQNDEQDLANSE